MQLVNGTRIYVPARVNGRDAAVLLDTGAAWTVIDKRFAEKLGLKSSGYRTTRGTGGTAPSQYGYGISIDLGHLRLRNVTVLVMDLSDVERRLGISLPVIVGPEAFATVITDLDIPAKTVTFWERGGWNPPAGAARLSATAVGTVRAVPISIEGRAPAPFLLDIGNGRAPLQIHAHYAKEQNLLQGRRTSTMISGAIGGERPVPVARLREIKFGGETLRDIPAQFPPDDGSAASDRGFAGNLGMPVLGRFRLITDFSDNALWVVPSKGLGAEFARDRSGITFSRSESGLTIVMIGGPATKSGLSVGDTIVAVREQGKSWQSVDKSLAWNTGRSGSAVQLKLASGKIRKVVLADYF